MRGAGDSWTALDPCFPQGRAGGGMRRLILFRHAKTEARAPAGEDFQRALTERGRGDARRMGEVLARAGLVPDLALISPAVRARQTWEEAKAAFPGVPAEFRHSLYQASDVELAVEIIPSAGMTPTLMVLAHNPGLQELGVSLLAERGLDPHEAEVIGAGFPTAAAAVLGFDAENRCQLLHFFRPSEHRS